MKKTNLLILLFFAFTGLTYCQSLKPDAVVRASHSAYNTKSIGSGNTVSIYAYNSKNIYYNKTSKNRHPNILIKRGDSGGMLTAFTKVFSDERLRELLPERVLLMTFYVNPSGKILEITFLLDKNTLVTAQELEALEKALKANVWFKLRPEDLKGEDFIDIPSGVSFKRILDRTWK
jgi:hypothetical protein